MTVTDPDEWRDICNNPFRAARETKLQSLHYKIIHRTFPCGAYLHRVRIRESDWCRFCDESDSITHHLFRCAKVQPFWDALCNWFRQEVNLYLDKLTAKEVILGLPREEMSSMPFCYQLSSTYTDRKCFTRGRWTCVTGWQSSKQDYEQKSGSGKGLDPGQPTLFTAESWKLWADNPTDQPQLGRVFAVLVIFRTQHRHRLAYSVLIFSPT